MSGTFKYGAVLSWKGFQFEDGGSSDKLLVVLGAKTGENILAVLTTSKQHERIKNPGCHIERGYFFVEAGKHGFHRDTWLELNRPQELEAAKVVQVSMAGDLHVVANLAPQLTNEIRNCLKQSRDITPHQLSLLE